jgi:fumarate hydratase class I
MAIGGDLVSCAEHAKEGLADAYDMPQLLARRDAGEILSNVEKLRIRLFEALNDTGVGAQGLGGKKTVLDVKVWTGSTHLAGCPVAISVQCSKPAHAGAVLDGSGAVTEFEIPDYAAIVGNLDAPVGSELIRLELPLTAEKIKGLKAGDEVLITGRIYTARDAAHQRLVAALAAGEDLPIPLQGQIIFYVGPIKREGKIIAAGPTTASRMDPYTPQLLNAGLSGIIGKGERGPAVVEAVSRNGAVYFIAVGGAAHEQAKAIVADQPIAYQDLGPEAILAYDVLDFPVVVAIDSEGANLHEEGRKLFAVKPR